MLGVLPCTRPYRGRAILFPRSLAVGVATVSSSLALPVRFLCPLVSRLSEVSDDDLLGRSDTICASIGNSCRSIVAMEKTLD